MGAGLVLLGITATAAGCTPETLEDGEWWFFTPIDNLTPEYHELRYID